MPRTWNDGTLDHRNDGFWEIDEMGYWKNQHFNIPTFHDSIPLIVSGAN